MFLREIDMEKALQELFWADFFGHSYHLNSTKIHLDAALSTNWISCNNVKKGKCKCMEAVIL